ncbi:putative lipoprotein [Paenibacillus algicola]|uniref:Putative lipoprotein n=1 Tax=Paenibacillus algicola TaxID=2565926 RepID=A0A4P8XS91_9BACL|nr:S-layer homology domain-containing protein [Paenibacillus algicola]QCT04761.1 putative lipoprotein [Paenibacillus algicola]
MKTKLLVKVMTTAALLSACALPAYSASANFMDIQHSYAKDAIIELTQKGILKGKSEDRFDPQAEISRQDFAIILARALQLDVTSKPSAPTFTDVPSGNYAYSYVEAAVKAGLLQGQGNQKFGFGQQLSRQDMAVLFTRALGVDAYGKGENLFFTDSSEISGYAKDAVGLASELQLIQGNPDGTFNPKGSADRQSVALMSSRFLKTKQELDNAATPPSELPVPQKPEAPIGSVPYIPSPAPSDPKPAPPVDRTAPVLTLISETSLSVTSPIQVRTSEAGTVYVISASQNPSTREQLEALVQDTKKAAKATVSSSNVETSISTNRLLPGEYKAIAIDAAGNVSSSSAAITLVFNTTEALNTPMLTIGESLNMLTLTFDEELDAAYLPSSSSFELLKYMNGQITEAVDIDRIEVSGNVVQLHITNPLAQDDLIIMNYGASLNLEQAIRSLSGKSIEKFKKINEFDITISAIENIALEIKGEQDSIIITSYPSSNNKIDIRNLVRVYYGSEEALPQYDSVENDFNIEFPYYSSQGYIVLGELKITTEDTDLLFITPPYDRPSGFTISRAAALTEEAIASL